MEKIQKDPPPIPMCEKILQLTRVVFAVFVLTILFGVSNCNEAWAAEHSFYHYWWWYQDLTAGKYVNSFPQIQATTFYCGDVIVFYPREMPSDGSKEIFLGYNYTKTGYDRYGKRYMLPRPLESTPDTTLIYTTSWLNSGTRAFKSRPLTAKDSAEWVLYEHWHNKQHGLKEQRGYITVHHIWSGWTRTANPTCTAQGSEYRTCTGCGEREVRAVAALGHTWSAKLDRGDGYSDQRCSKCGAVTNRTANTYYVAYNGNGATGGSTATSTHTYDAARTLTANGFTRTGYLFNGWATNTNGSGTKYNNQQSVKNLAKNNGATVNLYAQWTPVNYTVIYNGNGATGGSTAASSHTYNVAKNLTKNGFIPPTGRHFSGWTTNANGSGTKYNDQQTVVNLTTVSGGKVNLYAKWELNPFTVKFDGNGADSGTMNDQNFIYGNKQQLSKNQFTREYYEFLGWSTDKNATDPAILDETDGSTLTTVNGGTVTLYAIWKLSTVDITFHDQGGTGGPETVTWLIGSEQIPSIPTKDGNTFLEWNAKPDGTGTAWPKDNIVRMEMTDYYAQWLPEVYTAVYEPNEGENPGFSYRKATLLPGPEINRIFKELAGKPENIFYIRETSRCVPAGSYSIAENGTVRAYFQGNTIFIYSDAMQVQMNPDSAGMLAGLPNLKDIGTVKTWDAINATDMEGFFRGDTSLTDLDLTAWRTPNVENMASMFEGCTALTAIHADGNNWNTGSVGDYDKGANVFAGCVSLPGYGNAKTDITYATMDGYLTNTEALLDWTPPCKNIQKIECSAETILNKNEYTRAGYQFVGWSLNNDDVVNYNDQEKIDQITGEADCIIPMYAVWGKNPYTVQFDKHDEKAVGTMAPQNFYYDLTQPITANQFTKTGYYFDHWNLLPDNTGESFTDKQPVKNLTDVPNAALTMYAFWNANPYQIRFHKNHVSALGFMANQNLLYDQPQKLAENAYRREGYRFKSWNTAPDLTGTTYTDGQEVVNLTDVKDGIIDLYVEWEENQYTIRFDANGGEGVMEDMEMTYNQAAELSANLFTRPGYTFSGWTTNSDGTGTPFSDMQTVKNLTSKPDDVVTLYARWIPQTYMIQFAGGGATSGSMESQTLRYGEAQNLLPNQFVKRGYRFKNWRVVIDNKSSYYDDQALVQNLTTETGRVLTFTAQWEEYGYTVRFDKNAEAATGTMKSQLFTIDESQNLVANQFKQTGYVFAGWNTRPDGSGTAYADKALIQNLTGVNGETVILYAQWKPIQYQIVYDKNHPDATGTMTPVKTNYDRTIWIEDCGFLLDRQTFTGWNTKPDGSGTEYQPGTGVKNLTERQDDVITLYAQWKSSVYTIVFDKNAKSATGTMAAMEGEYNQKTALSKNQYQYKGYQFAGWNTKPDGSGIPYGNGEQILRPITDKNNVLTLYAQWEAVKYQVRFYGGAEDAEGSMLPQTFFYDQEASLKTNTFTRNGYMFKGWSTENRPGAAIAYKDRQTVKNLTDQPGAYIDLYAQWGDIGYQIHFDGNGSTNGSMEDITAGYDKQETLPKNQFARFGYEFTGWNTKKDGSGSDYTDEATVINLTDVPGGTVTLYAQWKADGYQVRFDKNGGHVTGTMKNQDLIFGNREKLSRNTYTRVGYTFAGWNLKPDGKGIPYQDGQEVLNLTIESGKEVVLYAQWTPITYKITFDPGAYNAIGTMEPQVVTYDKKTPIQKNAWTRKGYLFEGWCTSLDGAGTWYQDQEEILNLSSTQDEEVLLYAMWGHSAYYVEFQGNGATSGTMDRQEFIFNTAQDLNPNAFVRSGYQFAGWNTEADGSGKAYFDEETLKTEAETAGQVIVLYAQWAANERTVSYVLNGGNWASGFTPVTSGPYDEALQLPTAGQITREGYVFLGWYDNAALTGTSYTSLPANTGNKTLYAGWYNLSDKKNGISKPVKNDYEYRNQE